jgi:Tol biopolymer transport system component
MSRPPLSRNLVRIRPVVGPAVALIALVAVAVATADLLNGTIPTISRKPGGVVVGPEITPTPSNVIIVPPDPRSNVAGTIVYVKDGNLWLQHGASATQLTSTGTDSMPSFSPDGAWIYFIRTTAARGFYGCSGAPGTYDEQIPALMRLPTSGGDAQRLATGKLTAGRQSWFYFLRQPVASPNGQSVALVSDAPTPCTVDVTVQLFNLSTKRLTRLALPDTVPLGQQDPTWSPDGRTLLYVRNGASGALGTPMIYRYVVATRKATPVTGPGYLQPSLSPDGRYMAVTHLGQFGSDIVVLDAANGHELLRLTTDGTSTAPAWSPAGDAIVYLSTTSGVSDLHLVPLSGSGPNWTVGTPVLLTEEAGLDPGSRPSWFIPGAGIGGASSPQPTTSATASP